MILFFLYFFQPAPQTLQTDFVNQVVEHDKNNHLIFFVLFFAFIFQSTVLSQEENINSAKSSADSGTSQSVKKESDSASVSNKAVSSQEQSAKVENNKQ